MQKKDWILPQVVEISYDKTEVVRPPRPGRPPCLS